MRMVVFETVEFMRNGYIHLYNCEDLRGYDEKLIASLPEIDFYNILKKHFGEIEEESSHKNIRGLNYKIYFWRDGVLKNYIEVQYAGLRAVEALVILAKAQKWSLMVPHKKGLINLAFVDKEGMGSLVDFLEN